MNLDERSNQLFISMVHSTQETSKSLMKKFNMTRGQLNYDIQKINDWLGENHFEKIKRTKNGYFIISSEVIKKYQTKDSSINQSEFYLFSKEERIHLIEIMLLSKEEYLSLNHFIDALKLSKNTILRSLKELEKNIFPYNLELKYSRSNGYFIDGKEWNKRELLRDALNLLFENSNNCDQIIRFAQLDERQLSYYKKKLTTIEKELNVRFTDDQVAILPSFFLLISRRIEKGKTIHYNFELDFDLLSDTKEYEAIKEISRTIENSSEEEELYLTLQLLATNVSTADILTKGEIARMKVAMNKILTLFEKGSSIQIENRYVLLQQLMQHMKPAYYRIKYQINLKNLFYEANKTKRPALFYLVKDAIGPLEQFFEKEVPDVEIFFISLFIGSHILGTKESEVTEKQLTAVIVCPNGISISMLLERTLKQILPEINFIAVLSIREFYKQNLAVNYVFSAVPIKTSKELFIVTTFLSDYEKKQLRQRVLKTMTHPNQNILTPEKIIKIMKKHGAIEDESSLYYELLEMIGEIQFSKNEKNKIGLMDLLNEQTIQIFSETISWQDTIIQLSQSLLAAKVIEPTYVTKLLNDFPKIPPHIVLRESIVLPHADPMNGVLDVGLSLGILKKGLDFEGKKIYLVVLLASNDKQKHIEAIFQLMELAGKSDWLAQLRAVNSSAEVINLLEKFIEVYRREQHAG